MNREKFQILFNTLNPTDDGRMKKNYPDYIIIWRRRIIYLSIT